MAAKNTKSAENGRTGCSLPADLSVVNELWLFKGTREQRIYKASFVGIKTRRELIDGYGYPAKGKAHGDRYLLFKTEFKYQHKNDVPEDADRVIVRAADFAKRSPKIAKQLKAYLESPDRLERAGIHVVIASEIMPDFAATLAANHPGTNVIDDDTALEAAQT